MNTNLGSLYVHIPFCSHLCAYCGFTKFVFNEERADRYVEKIVSQLEEFHGTFETLYVGGGTPTALTTRQLAVLFSALSKHVTSDTEFTVEGNPESINPETIGILKANGVNRFSMGVQCSQPWLLKEIGRQHTFDDVIAATQVLINHGISDYSMDLMYGFQDQTLSDFKESIDKVLDLNPTHVSLYSLTIEDNSVFGKKKVKTVDEDTETEMYLLAIKMLTERGYHHYEISNFAKPSYESRHNKVYWHYQPYYALGVGASQMVDHHRQTYTTSFVKYMKETSFDEDLALTPDDEMFEFIMMGLRLKEGISKKEFLRRYGISIHVHFEEAIRLAKEKHLLIETEDVLKTTDEGFIMLFDTLLYFMD